jgi:7-cyano-7-deazaguanine synthase in queuosine biosynthesis
VTVAAELVASGATAARGICPWRLTFVIDGHEVCAFFKPPTCLEDSFDEADASLLALPIACHLAAEVRPKVVTFKGNCSVPGYTGVFRSAIGALLTEQDAYWGRRRFSIPPLLRRSATAGRAPSGESLNARMVILGFSGGKDSLVCLFSLLDAGYRVIPLLLNEGDRTWQDLRRWVPKLRALGLQPLTAYLRIQPRATLRDRYGEWHRSSYQIGWLSLLLGLTAEKLGAAIVAMGLESSADRVGHGFRGRFVNHQHQKTTAHILQIEEFLRKTVHRQLCIASPIAPFSDEDILNALFARVPRNWRQFSSCGSSNSSSKHCGTCDKCAYVFALLARSQEGRKLAGQVFRRNLFQDVELYRPWIDARFREPDACIGERWELWAALEDALQHEATSPVLRTWAASPFRSELRRHMRDSHCSSCDRGAVLSQPVRHAVDAISGWNTG